MSTASTGASPSPRPASISANWAYDTSQPIYGSSALLFVGSADIYAFFATGSDLLPVTTTGGTGTFKLFGLKDNYPSAPGLQFSRSLGDDLQRRRDRYR